MGVGGVGGEVSGVDSSSGSGHDAYREIEDGEGGGWGGGGGWSREKGWQEGDENEKKDSKQRN